MDAAPKTTWVRRIIATNISPALAAGIGAAFTLPSIVAGLAFDDYVHRAAILHRTVFRDISRLDIFRFTDGTVERGRLFREMGISPWYARLDARMAFFRPLASLSHWIDYGILNLPAWAMHVESIALYALLVYLASRFFRRVISVPGVAGLASLMYALDPGHGVPTGWLANRNALLASTFGIATLLAHDRARRDGWRAGAIFGPLFFALALLSGEPGLPTFGYVLAHAFTLDRGPRRARVFAVLPYVAVGVAWQIAYRALHYGALGSAFYLDPFEAPLRFVVAVVQRVPALLAGTLVLFPSELMATSPGAAWAIGPLLAAVTAVGAWALAPIVKRDMEARFFALGALLSVPVLSTTVPANRLMVLAGVGVVGLVAKLLADVSEHLETRKGVRAFAWAAAAAHFGFAPFLLPFNTVALALVDRYSDHICRDVPRVAQLSGTDVVVVRSPSYLLTVYRFVVPRGPEDPPHSLRVLSMGPNDVRVRRIDAQTIEVRADEGLEDDPLAGLLRDTPLRQGEVATLSNMTATVTEVNSHGVPVAATFRFASSLDDSSRSWFTFEGDRFRRYVPPPIPTDSTPPK